MFISLVIIKFRYIVFLNLFHKICSNTMKKLIVLSSPSGGGKSTVARFLLKNFDLLRFSVSATTRMKRPRELHGREYYFLDRNEFEDKIENGEFVEYEEIYGNYYGTLRTEIDKTFKVGKCLLFDIDVKGALSLQKEFPKDTVLIFITPPSLMKLELRLRKRQTETDEQINRRLERAEMEIKQKDKFDHVIINDELEDTLEKVKEIVAQYLPVTEIAE